MRSAKCGRSKGSVNHPTEEWLSDFESDLRILLPVDSLLSTNSALGLPTQLPPEIRLEMLTSRTFRVSLSAGVSLEYVDVYFDHSRRPFSAIYHFEGLTGSCELNIAPGSSLFEFVADCYRRYSS